MTVQPDPTQTRERWFFLGSGLVLVGALLVALAKEHHWGDPMVPLQLTSRHAGALRPGQEVRISGMPVGQVTAMQLQPDASVHVQPARARRGSWATTSSRSAPIPSPMAGASTSAVAASALSRPWRSRR